MSTFPKCLLACPILMFSVSAADAEPARISIVLPAAVAMKAHGRLLLFAQAATTVNAQTEAVDVGGPDGSVLVIAQDVRLHADSPMVLDEAATTFPQGALARASGEYRVQVVLDRDGSYGYYGRGAGDLVSRVTTLRFPLTSTTSIPLDHAIPPEAGQFDVTGLPPAAAAQITASRPHLHEEHIASPLLARFHGDRQAVAAWVLTPPGYDPTAGRTYPTVFMAGGFGGTHKLDGQQLSRQWHLMETGAIPPMIWVALDFGTQKGATEFADSANNGPWGRALTEEVIPTLEARYRMDAKPSGRFLTGHSSGGWFALWTMVHHPALFGGAWATAPDPVDFHDFLGVDLYARDANMYSGSDGHPRPLERADGAVRSTIDQAAGLESVLGPDGGQLASFEQVFSPRRRDGTPAPLFDRRTGRVDPAVAGYWCDHYDIARLIERSGSTLQKDLDGKVHVVVGTEDSFYLDGPVHLLERAFSNAGVRADFTYVAGASHGMSQVYSRGGDRNGLWRDMARDMYAIARPQRVASLSSADRIRGVPVRAR